jgi:hypothetical protein
MRSITSIIFFIGLSIFLIAGYKLAGAEEFPLSLKGWQATTIH